MARLMRRLKDDPSKTAKRQDRKKERQSRERKADAGQPLGKTFAELTSEEKDDILKRLAIMAGLVEE